MSHNDQTPPAYPSTNGNSTERGISLRDHMAINAPYEEIRSICNVRHCHFAIARYMWADEMLDARER